MQIAVELTPFPLSEHSGQRRVSQNSFGYGGTNAHVILESAPMTAKTPEVPVSVEQHDFSKADDSLGHNKSLRNNPSPLDGFSSVSSTSSTEFSTNRTSPIIETSSINGADIPSKNTIYPDSRTTANDAARCSTKDEESPKLFIVTANSEESLRTSIKSLHKWIAACAPRPVSLQDLSYTLAVRRSLLPWRHTVVASTQEELTGSLSFEKPRIARISPNIRVAFVFTGQDAHGMQWDVSSFLGPHASENP